MTPFLLRIAQTFYSEYGNELYKHTFVFPNKRAGVFFRKYLSETATKPIFSPSVITINELFESFSEYQLADNIMMLEILYKNYKNIIGSHETFDDFLYWGEILLNDFDNVDKYMVDVSQLFKNISNLKSLDDDFSHLTPSQVEAIRRFWAHFMPVEDNETKQKFVQTWDILFELYTNFRNELKENGYAYEGMLFREVADRAKAKEDFKFGNDSFIFVGLNSISTVEYELMNYLKNSGVADFYWDYESPLVHDKENRASMWVEENLSRFPSKFEQVYSGNSSENGTDEKTKIELIGIPSAVGQAKHVAEIISKLIEEGHLTDDAINTAIVLPDESLLLPTLYSIPKEIDKINVTMGYSLTNASVASLVENISLLQKNIRKSGDEQAFYFRHVLSILNHPLVMHSIKSDADNIKNDIVNFNRVTVSTNELKGNALVELIFKPIEKWQDIPEYLHEILISVYNSIESEIKDKDEELNAESSRAIDLEREFIVEYYKVITRLQGTLTNSTEMSIDTYFRLLKRLTKSINVSFSGEPLSGLQIMGTLETRVLDFDNLIILSMNEGIFPKKSSQSSFIPYTLRKTFGLPTNEHQDSKHAYYFYRMISRAKRVFMLYDTRTEDLQTGEVSRFFNQLKYLYADNFEIAPEKIFKYRVFSPKVETISVSKTNDVLNKLNRFRVGGESALSASLINNYINCPLQFYFSAVEGLKQEEEVSESVEASVFGSIFHRLMEVIYNRFVELNVTDDAINEIIKNDKFLTEIIEKAFARYYFKNENDVKPLKGHYYLIGEILRSYVIQTLNADRQFTPFRYIGSEHRIDETYRVNDSLEINFRGSIDRIDLVDNSYRIIDYKTGTGETKFNSIEQLFDSSKDKRPYQILQVFIYALFYGKKNPDKQLSPAIYYLRFIFKDFDPAIYHQKDKNRIDKIENIEDYMPEFIEQFNSLITEIFNPDIPFSQTLNETNCQWCAFRTICGK